MQNSTVINKTEFETLDDFDTFLCRLKPVIKKYGGRVFVDDLNREHKLNQLIAIFENLNCNIKSRSYRRWKCFYQILHLNEKKAVNIQEIKFYQKIFTVVRKFFGNLIFRREARIAKIKKDISVLAKDKFSKNLNIIKSQEEEPKKNFQLSEEVKEENFFIDDMGMKLDSYTYSINGNEVALVHCQGRRETMEDEALADELEITLDEKKCVLELYGVFDGHKDKSSPIAVESSPYLKQHFVSYFKTALITYALPLAKKGKLTQAGIWAAFKFCFENLLKDFSPQSKRDGCTATVAMVYGDKKRIYVANLGDARTSLYQVDKKKLVGLTDDAKPNKEKYKKEIEKRGGKVFYNERQEIYRVGGKSGVLNMTRSFGDKEISVISTSPMMSTHVFDKGDYLLLSCDGPYEVASHHEMEQAMIEMVTEDNSPKIMSSRLVKSSIESGSCDNQTVLIVKLDNP